MDCARAREMIDLRAAGEIRPDEAGELERHLEICAGCRALDADARAAASLAREALSHFEPGDAFEAAVLERIERKTAGAARPAGRVLRLAVPLAAAAAVVLAVWLGRGGPPAARLIEGELSGGEAALAGGGDCTAEAECAVGLTGGARVLLAKGSVFSVAKRALTLGTGSCYLVSALPVPEQGPVARTVVRVNGLSAEVSGGAEIYLRASVAAAADDRAGPARSLADILLDLVSSRVYAAGPEGPGALIVVFNGSARVECGGRVFEMGPGEGLFADRAADGTFRTQEFLERSRAEIAEAERLSSERSEAVARYRAVIASYEASLVAKAAERARLTAQVEGGGGAGALAELDLRTRLVTGAKTAHERRLAELLRGTAEARRAELADLGRRMDLVGAAEAGYWSAAQKLKGYGRAGE